MKWLMRVAIVVLLLVALAFGGWYLNIRIVTAKLRIGKQPGVNVTVSKETTVITEPLRKDGYVNYLSELNRRGAEGVTPENNAAVLLWQAAGPNDIKQEMRDRYFRMLGMPPPPEHGDYFVALDKDAEPFRAVKDPHLTKPIADGGDPVEDEQTAAMDRPWSPDEFPLIGVWIAVNEKPLALLVAASKRPRFYCPLLCGDSDEGNVFAADLPYLQSLRKVARPLRARAMLRLKTGNVSEAWDDLLACHRLARLAAQGPTLIDGLVAIAIDGIASKGDEALLRHTHLTSVQAAKMRDDLAALPPLPKMADKLDVSERFEFLDCVSTGARDGFKSLGGLGPGTGMAADLPAAVLASLDWDAILRMGNSWYDRLVAAARLPTRSARLAEFDKIDRDLKALSKSNSDWKAKVGMFISPNRSELVGNTIICLMIPALTACNDAEDRATMQAELVQLGFALAAYHADHASYPKQLSELAPRYVAKLPTDIFASDGELHYQRQGEGCLLYSVGPNGRDDRGRGRDEGEKAGKDWDDMSVRVP